MNRDEQTDRPDRRLHSNARPLGKNAVARLQLVLRKPARLHPRP